MPEYFAVAWHHDDSGEEQVFIWEELGPDLEETRVVEEFSDGTRFALTRSSPRPERAVLGTPPLAREHRGSD